jgi:hypothetical protein
MVSKSQAVSEDMLCRGYFRYDAVAEVVVVMRGVQPAEQLSGQSSRLRGEHRAAVGGFRSSGAELAFRQVVGHLGAGVGAPGDLLDENFAAGCGGNRVDCLGYRGA